MVAPMFDSLSGREVQAVMDAFPQQPLDFFSAVQARLADGLVRAWLAEVSKDGPAALEAALLGDPLMHDRDSSYWLNHERVRLSPQGASLQDVLAAGRRVAEEGQLVADVQLKWEYFRALKASYSPEAKLQPRSAPPPPLPPQKVVSVTKETEAYWAMLAASSAVSQERIEAVEADAQAAAEEEAQLIPPKQEAPKSDRAWPVVTADDVAAALASGSAAVLDVRTLKEWEWGRIKGAVHCPVVVATGSSLNPGIQANVAKFADQVAAKFPRKAQPLVLVASGAEAATGDGKQQAAAKGAFVSRVQAVSGDLDLVALAVEALLAQGYTAVSELHGGFKVGKKLVCPACLPNYLQFKGACHDMCPFVRAPCRGHRRQAYDLGYRPDGRKREKGKWADKSSGELEYWTASN